MSELSPAAWRLRRCLLSIDRNHVQLAEVWSCFLHADPDAHAAGDRRARLRRALDELAGANWVALPSQRHQYDAGEPALPRFITALPPAERAQRLGAARAVKWHEQLGWVANLHLSAAVMSDLRRIDHWLARRTDDGTLVPPRERSLQLFGAGRQDRLHELAATELFGPQRLTWELLHCVPVPPPFVSSPVGPGTTLLVVSSHETFASVRRVLVDSPSTGVGVVAHGAGRYFQSSVLSASTLDRAIDRILFYGDLAEPDIDTAQRASRRSVHAGLPAVEPAVALYELLLAHGKPSTATPVPIERVRTLVTWLPPALQQAAIRLLSGGRSLTQEWVGYELLVRARIWEQFNSGTQAPA